jgi:hypothetical protein
MAEQRGNRFWFTVAATALLAAVLVWWLARARDESEPSTRAEESASASGPSLGKQRRSAPKLDLVQAPKAAVSGTIRSLDGQPIADAQVCALSDVTERRGLDDRKPHCVRSGPDGRYHIDELLPIKTEVHASAASFKPNLWEQRERGIARIHVPLRAGQTTKGIDVTLESGGVLIEGIVRDIAGGEIEGALVMASGGMFRSSRATSYGQSGAEGRFELWTAPGNIRVGAQVEGYAQGWVDAIAPGEFVELYLTPESVLVGKVVLASSGEPVEGAVVSASGWGPMGSARSDANGLFRIDQLGPGIYKPRAESEELFGQAAEQVHLGLGQTSDEVVIRVHPAVHIEGTVVVAGSEQPCTSGEVRLEAPESHYEQAQLDDEGHVEFRGVPPGEYSVTVSCSNYVAADEYDKLAVEQTSITGIVWEVREGLSIRGVVVDESGQPLAKVPVRAAPVVAPDAARSQATNVGRQSEVDGSFELGGLLPGRYEVTSTGWRSRPGPLEPTLVELESGADVNDVRIVMPAVGSVRGRVLDESGKPVSGATITASSMDMQGYGESRSNDVGEFTIEHLRPGQARIAASSGEYWWTSAMRKPGTTDDDLQGEVVTVVANETVELTLTVESRDGRITGVVKDEHGGPVSDAFIDAERMSEKAGANAASARRGVRWGGGTKPVLTDADGRFEIDELPDGRYIVGANRKGGGQAVLEDVALGSHVELIITSTGEFSGTVTLAGGGAPERFTISLEDKAAGIHLGDSYYRTDGVWRIREVPAGSYEISASASEGTTKIEPAITLGEGEVRSNLELVLEPRVTVRGRLIDLETREPVAGLEVMVSGSGGFMMRSTGERQNVTGADGRFEVEDAPTGRVEIMAWNRTGGSKTKYGWHHQALTVETEPAVQDIGDIEVVARRLENNEKPGDLGFELNEWDPTVKPEDWKPVVASVRPGGPADGSGLVAGDVIEKVNGHDVIGNPGSRYTALTSVPAGTTITLGLSEGKTVEIIVGPAID